MRVSVFTHDFLLLFAGPVVWAVHFLVIYGFTGVACARPSGLSWLGVGIATWVIVGAGITAVAAIAGCLAVKPKAAAADSRSFVRWLSVALGLLSVVAIVWETITVFLIPSCA